MQNSSLSVSADPAVDLEHGPQEVMLAGQLFLFAEQSVCACTVTHLSTSCAIVRCEETPPTSSAVLLYVVGFGRFRAVTRSFKEGNLELHLEISDSAEKRLKTQLEAFRDGGLLEVTRTRKHMRVRMAVKSQFTRADGSIVPCTISDVSLGGMYLKTDARPAIGERITIGGRIGAVIRYDNEGIGIGFEMTAERDGPHWG
jgi:PilZ domain